MVILDVWLHDIIVIVAYVSKVFMRFAAVKYFGGHQWMFIQERKCKIHKMFELLLVVYCNKNNNN